MAHKVEISDKTYEDLKVFCSLNNLKIGQFADKLIHDGLMIEMYGDVPFTNYRMPKREEIVELVREAERNSYPISEETSGRTRAAQVVKDVIEEFKNTAEIFETMQKKVKPIDKETKAQMIETKEKAESECPQTYITNQEGKGEVQEEMPKQTVIPTKTDKKIIKRRLK